MLDLSRGASQGCASHFQASDADMTSEPAHMNPARSFQGLILTLQRYWAEQGCVILQPYDMEVGAGTFHPATTLRGARATPWEDACLPCVCPARGAPKGRPLGRDPEPAAALLSVPGVPEALAQGHP